MGTSASETIIKAPSAEGSYNLFLVDAFGQASPASTNSITVDNTAPTVNASRFVVGDYAKGTNDTLSLTAGGVSEVAVVKAYLWTDTNKNDVVNEGELGTAINLGNSAADGSVAASSIGDLIPENYKYVITATDVAGNESTKAAGYAVTFTLKN